MRYDELSIFERNHLQQSVGSMGVDITLLAPEAIDDLLKDYEAPKTPLHDLAKANELSAQNRAWRRNQARVDRLQAVVAGSPDLPPAEEFARAYGFTDALVAEQFEQQQQAAVEELRQAKAEAARIEAQLEFDEAAKEARNAGNGGDYLALIQIGDNENHPFQAEARALMAELWPSFDNWS